MLNYLPMNTSADPDQWVDIYGDALYSYALKFIPHGDIAENLVQETFLSALQGSKGFKGKADFKSWLIGILKNKISDHLRLKYKEIPVSQMVDEDTPIEQFFDTVSGHLAKEPQNWDLKPDQILENEEFWRIYNDCLSRLPEKTAQAFSFREIEAMDSKEICKVLKIAPTNLWVLLHRARVQLRQCLEINWLNHDR